MSLYICSYLELGMWIINSVSNIISANSAKLNNGYVWGHHMHKSMWTSTLEEVLEWQFSEWTLLKGMSQEKFQSLAHYFSAELAPIVQGIAVVVSSNLWDRHVAWAWVSTLYMFTSVSNCVDRLTEESSRDSAHGWCMATPICYFSKMPQVRTMHDKPGCVQT